jgi:hypothetical protein
MKPDSALVRPLSQKLNVIADLGGEADMSEIYDDYTEWYTTTKTRFLAHPNSALSRPFFNRHRIHILKMAVVFEASESGTLIVSQRAWVRAVEFMHRAEQVIFDLLPTGMNAQGFLLQRFEEKIKQAGSEGISRNDLTRTFQSIRLKDREECLATLEQAERIEGRQMERTSDRGGRPRTVYVHADYF